MAAIQEVLQTSVPLPEIPVKLRCNICSGLARGAVRLPCCEQAICETCRENLPNVCPVCDHSPLNSDDCKPNSALRTTVAVFLRTAEKKHALALQKELKATQQQQLLQQQQQQQPQQLAQEPTPIPETKASEPQPTEQAAPTPAKDQASAPVSKPNTPVTGPATLALNEDKESTPGSAKGGTEGSPQAKTDKDPRASPIVVQQQMDYSQHNGPWFNSQQMNMGQPMFPSQDMSGWGGYPMQGGWDNGYANGMMGYTMMNPMAMAQSGYGGGNFGNMGAGGFNGQNVGGVGGWGNGWNGQNNMGFNHGMAGMRNGGYYSAASAGGGYNHQSSQGSHQVPSQQYQNPHFQRQQNFLRGGGFAGGVGNRPSDPSQQQQQSQQSQQQISQHRLQQEQAYEDAAFQQQIQGIEEVAKKAPSSTGDETTKGEKIPSIVSGELDDINAATVDIADLGGAPAASLLTGTESTVVAGSLDESDQLDQRGNLNATTSSTSTIPTAPMHHADMSAQAPYPIAALHDDYSGQNFQGFPQYHQQPYMNGGFPGGRGGFRGNGFVGNRAGFRGSYGGLMRGGHFDGPIVGLSNGMSMGGADTKIVPDGFGKGVEGAPTGPKAMREGRPNRGIPSRGGFTGRAGYSTTAGSSWSRSMSPNERTDRGRSYSRSVSIDSRRRSRSPASRRHQRSRSRSRSQKHTPTATSERGRTPIRDTEDHEQPTPTADSTAITPPPQGTSAPTSGRGNKRSREPSEDRAPDDIIAVGGSRPTSRSRSRSRSAERRHKRSRRHRKRSTSPDRERDRDRRHHKRSSHRSHRSSRKHRSDRPRSRSRSRSPRRDGDDVDDRIRDEDRPSRRSGSKDRGDRRHKRRSSRERRDRDRDRAERDRRPHRSHHRRGSRHERTGYGDNDIDEKSHAVVVEERDEKVLLGERKMSYKYEDEGDLERRAERDREAERWGVK